MSYHDTNEYCEYQGYPVYPGPIESCPSVTVTEEYCPGECPFNEQYPASPVQYSYSQCPGHPECFCGQCEAVPITTRPAIPVNVWQDVLVNFRRGNAGALAAMLKNAGPILKQSIIPLLRIIREQHKNNPKVVKQPVTYWV